ncbi:iron-siderophore ABC transporter substrate-binding protein [Nisaea sp.]|uniref:iron-siderophore ABC transporter substrate-binding protein n=2 Tax=Nisaea sp. TaxID=2024842 RepID=UPI0032989FF1
MRAAMPAFAFAGGGRMVFGLFFLIAGAFCSASADAACDGRLISREILGPPVCVPEAPKRIVVLDPLLTFGILYELGVPVVGTPLVGIQETDMRAEAEQAGVADLGHPFQPSLERIVALRPDLIIGASYIHAKIHQQVARIAPTLLIDHMDWKNYYRLLAEITGKSIKAEQAIEIYEHRAAAIRKRVSKREVSVVRVAPMGFRVYLDSPAAYAPYAVLREAGVTRTPYETAAGDAIVKRPDWEELGALDGDILLYVVFAGLDPAKDDALETITLANPLWQALTAVKAGKAYRVDRATWMGFHGIASAHRVLDAIESFIPMAR